MTLLAYNNDPKLKKSVLKEMADHVANDRLVKGKYWKDGKGCAVGCLINSGNHIEYESRFGIPKELAKLEDEIFEGLPNDKSMVWPEKFLSSFKVGKDYSKVWNRFAVWMLIDPEFGVIRNADDQGKVAIKNIANLHEKVIRGIKPRKSSWSAAYLAACSAVKPEEWSAAYSASRSAAYLAARSAAWSAKSGVCLAAYLAVKSAAESAAESAVYSAVKSAAWSAAYSAAYERMSEKLIELIKGE